MTHEDLDRMIHRFREDMPSATSPSGLFFTRHDWRPAWALAKAIQDGFSSGVRYPTRELHQDAWRRFNELRDEANVRAKDERTWLEIKSKRHRDIILDICKGIGWSPIADIIFFYDQTTVEQMKGFQKYLSQAMRELKERKHEMLEEHKQECFTRIQEIKEQHEHFWSQYRQARDIKKEKYEAGKEAFKARTRENLSMNENRLRKAKDALERFEAEASELRLKIEDDDASEKWRGIWSGWLDEKKTRIANIEEHIQRIEEWIDEDRRKLSTID